ncbi:transcription factor bHLH51-like [Cornus florida]|uniref:transcription factor bHLH51-like n=1 Tax=Cornus florida TaxID=4283 RepID=UPI002898CD18|nr:transcription factor bHLH51-like [Cornus florida]
MANCYCSGWPEEASNCCVQSQSAINKDTSFLVPSWLPSSDSTQFQFHGHPSWPIPFEEGGTEDRAASSSKSHSQAEKRRRDRINAQLATLRKLIPKSDKMDKAALLGSVVEHVKDLKRKAVEVSQGFTIPSDVDEVTVDCEFDKGGSSSINGETSNDDEQHIFIRASVCCDDRPELFAELTQALKGLELRTVKADVSSLGGRIRSILILCTKDCKESVCMNNLKQSLKVVLGRIALSSTVSNYRIKSKRQRFFLPSHC